jgi:hypothetical protein
VQVLASLSSGSQIATATVAVWGDNDEAWPILVAVVRYLAAHSPTERATLEKADVARRLMWGESLHQE